MNRREFIATSISGTILAKNDFYLPKSPMGTQISVFSKTLHWIEDPQILAQTIADLGFNGIDLTVRPDGHVLPEKVENDLPKFVASAQKAGISIPMIVSSILQADSLSKKVIETAGKNGISHYRMGWFRYEMGKDIMPQVQQFTENVRQLATINEKFNISGEYQNHGGPNLGASLWDIAPILSNINSPFFGLQYDINHSLAESGANWETAFRLIHTHIKSIAIKDFKWSINQGKLVKVACPLGEGIVDWKKYFQLLKQFQINVPITIHYEYDLGGAENGSRNPKIDKNQILSAMQKDLSLVRAWLKEAEL